MTDRVFSSVMVMAELRAVDVMTTDPIVVAARTVHGATPLPELVARFAAEDTRALVVVDSDGRVLGVVTSATLLNLLGKALLLGSGQGTRPASG